jgi:hypothetical protein
MIMDHNVSEEQRHGVGLLNEFVKSNRYSVVELECVLNTIIEKLRFSYSAKRKIMGLF